MSRNFWLINSVSVVVLIIYDHLILDALSFRANIALWARKPPCHWQQVTLG